MEQLYANSCFEQWKEPSYFEEMRNPNGSQRDAPVTVTFPIPRKAARKLRTMAVSRDRRLLDLGVLAVQINEGESIVLGIKLGKQKIKNTEASSEKLRGNARRGRVHKKPSNCRNVATIHHMPDVCSSKFANNLETAPSVEAVSGRNDLVRKKVSLQEREMSRSDIILDEPSNNSCKFRELSHFTTGSFAMGVSLNGQSSSLKLSEYQNKTQNTSNNTVDKSLKSQGSNTQQTNERLSNSPANITSRNVSVESLPSAAQNLSSPISQRAYSASPISDTSSTSSEENFDIQHDLLIYNCFVDRSKYSAVDMLKELAASHASRKSTTGHAGKKVKLTAVNAKPKEGKSLLYPSGDGSNNVKSKISSYRDHVKNIRCNSLTSPTTCISTVNSASKVPTTENKKTSGLQNSGRTVEKAANVETRPETKVAPPFPHRTTLSKPSTASQTKRIKVNPRETAVYHGGRKVLWSSTNVFPRCASSSADFPDTCTLPQSKSSSDRQVSSLSNASSLTSCAASFSDTIMSTATSTNCSNQKSNLKPLKHELVDEKNTLQSDSKTSVVVTGSSSLSVHCQQSLPVQNTSCWAATSARSACIPGITNFVQTEASSTTIVQNLTIARPVVSSTISVAGTNTHTTWSNQQVSPTYFVGAQGQYGIYSALYSSDCSNNQHGPQSVAAAYVYPVSFIYPYLAMAQANPQKSLQNETVEKEKLEAKQSETPSTGNSQIKNVENTEKSTTKVESMTTTAVPAQTQFIDLASSMRYCQLSLLPYRSRMQALPSCNLPILHALCTSSVSTTSATSTDVTSSVVSSESAVKLSGSKASVNSHSGEPSLHKPDISEENSLLSSYSKKMQIMDFSKKTPNNKLSQQIEQQINLQEKSLKEPSTSDRQSVIVSASDKKNYDHKNKIQSPSGNLPSVCKHSVDGSEIKNSDSVFCQSSSQNVIHFASFQQDQLGHIDDGGGGVEDNNIINGPIPVRLQSSIGESPPKLSFIHDSSIACVNVGNSNGIGGSSGSSSGARRLSSQLDSVGHPAKRRKSKKSL